MAPASSTVSSMGPVDVGVGVGVGVAVGVDSVEGCGETEAVDASELAAPDDPAMSVLLELVHAADARATTSKLIAMRDVDEASHGISFHYWLTRIGNASP